MLVKGVLGIEHLSLPKVPKNIILSVVKDNSIYKSAYSST